MKTTSCTALDPYDIVATLQKGKTYLIKQNPFITPFGEELTRETAELVFLGVSSRGVGYFEEGKPSFIQVHNLQKNLVHLIFIQNISETTLVCSPQLP